MIDFYRQKYADQTLIVQNSAAGGGTTVNSAEFESLYGYERHTMYQVSSQNTEGLIGSEDKEHPPTETMEPRKTSMDFGDRPVGSKVGTLQFAPTFTADQTFWMPHGRVFQEPSQGAMSDMCYNQPLTVDTQYMNHDSFYSDVTPPFLVYPSPMQGVSGPEHFMLQHYCMPFDFSNAQVADMASHGMIPFNYVSQSQSSRKKCMTSPNPGFTGLTQSLTDDPGGERIYSNGSNSSSEDNQTRNSHDLSKRSSRPQLRQYSTSSQGQGAAKHIFTNIPHAINIGQQIQFPFALRMEGSEDNNRLSAFSTSMPVRPGNQAPFQNAYSSTGFDMLKVLMRIATRPNPKISLGAVDLSCAFVVCDASEHDFPIVYCSENFERLTGYTKHEILGRNCRFLQAPDGKVQAGVQRNYVDDGSVLYLKNMVTARKEAQVSLINYRKGGQPFMNLLTVIPIPYDDTEEIKFFVGLQVDLVEQPQSVTNKNPDGSYMINYQRGLAMPRYVYSSERQSPTIESGQTVSRDDVSIILNALGTGQSELSRRLWDKVLLENTDDVVFVLSLKGLFLYLSASCKAIFEYDASELVGTALSSVCHPSDIVPVTRELKDTSSLQPLNVVFRIRRKRTGYMWFEGHGALHAEQGKGRKSVVLVGRERPVYTISKGDILASGGITDHEVWTKMSTSGMFLFVPSNIRSMLDRQPEELVGTSMQALMRADSRTDFGRALEVARTGKKASTKHDLINKRGQVMQAFSTIYPGDAPEGQKPTFIIAQTRLMKYSRTALGASQRCQMLPKSGSGSSDTISMLDARTSAPGNPFSPHTTKPPALPASQQYISMFETAMTHAGQNGLVIGRQDLALASDENLFEELKTTRSTSWQFELRQMEKRNRLLAEELQGLLMARKKRKRRKGSNQIEKDCVNCHTRSTPEWRRGPSGNRDLCNSCGLRWAKQQGAISPRTSRSTKSVTSEKMSGSPLVSYMQTIRECGTGDSSAPNEQSHVSQAPNQPGSRQEPSTAIVDGHVLKAAKLETQPVYSYGSVCPTKFEEYDKPET